MREIKFRAWNGEFMIDNVSLPFGEQAIIMQYTGLKDRNGKEIYEGDILNVNEWGFRPNKNLLGVCEMVWDADETGWNFKPYIIEDRYDFRKAVSNSEIIGNVYENPKLI